MKPMLQGVGQVEDEHTARPQPEVDQSEDQPADDRSGDTELAEKRYIFPYVASQEIKDNGQCYGLIHVKR